MNLNFFGDDEDDEEDEGVELGFSLTGGKRKKSRGEGGLGSGFDLDFTLNDEYHETERAATGDREGRTAAGVANELARQDAADAEREIKERIEKPEDKRGRGAPSDLEIKERVLKEFTNERIKADAFPEGPEGQEEMARAYHQSMHERVMPEVYR